MGSVPGLSLITGLSSGQLFAETARCGHLGGEVLHRKSRVQASGRKTVLSVCTDVM